MYNQGYAPSGKFWISNLWDIFWWPLRTFYVYWGYYRIVPHITRKSLVIGTFPDVRRVSATDNKQHTNVLFATYLHTKCPQFITLKRSLSDRQTSKNITYWWGSRQSMKHRGNLVQRLQAYNTSYYLATGSYALRSGHVHRYMRTHQFVSYATHYYTQHKLMVISVYIIVPLPA